jgi:pyruvate dehydrogenase E1 component alpha subunit
LAAAYNCDTPSLDVSVTKDELIQMYREMTTMRRMEMAADALYKAKMIRGFCHLAIGQEAVSVGMEHGIDKNDRVITGYRCHPFAVLRGGTIQGVLAELLGRKGGESSFAFFYAGWWPYVWRGDGSFLRLEDREWMK